MSAPLVTVVTPVYNGEDHLAECIESVLGQTYQNWEYVVVDNCSTDGTPAIVEKFARSDGRIQYQRHDEFVDVIASYNRSLGVLTEDSVYCKVLGADDWLFPECLAKMVEVAEENPAVGVVGGYRLNGRQVDLDGYPYWQPTQPGREVVAADLRSSLPLLGTPSALLLRCELMRHRTPFYDPTFRHADTEAAYWALSRSDYGLVHQVVTYNREATSPETVSSNRLASYTPERIRMLIRYGPLVLSPEQYREELRIQLREYVRLIVRAFAGWHAKRRFKSEPARNEAFHTFQVQALEFLAEDGRDDREVRRAVRLARKLLGWY